MILERVWYLIRSSLTSIGNLQARLLMLFFYYFLVAPFAIIVRIANPVSEKKHAPAWVRRETREEDPLERARKQY